MAKGKYGPFRSTGNPTDPDFGIGPVSITSGNSDSGNPAAAADAGTDTDSSDSGDAAATADSRTSAFTDPAIAFGIEPSTDDTAAAPKRRGRPPGSGKRNGITPSKSKKVSTSLEGIEGILLSLHVMGAALLKVPELQLSPEEAEKLTDGINRVASLYDFGASEKTLAWVNLAVVAGGIYGTRAFAYNIRIKSEARKAKELKEPKVTPFPTFQNQL